jgi:hypothetical protein
MYIHRTFMSTENLSVTVSGHNCKFRSLSRHVTHSHKIISVIGFDEVEPASYSYDMVTGLLGVTALCTVFFLAACDGAKTEVSMKASNETRIAAAVPAPASGSLQTATFGLG